jgi:hypothetical protein
VVETRGRTGDGSQLQKPCDRQVYGTETLSIHLVYRGMSSMHQTVKFGIVRMRWFKPDAAAEARICTAEEIREECHLFIYSRKLREDL